MSLRARRKRQRGFTLLEALCAMTLFALVSSAVGTLAVASIRRTTENRHATQAVLLAQWQMEQLRGLDYPSITSGSTSKSMGNQNYSIVTNVQPNQPAANMSTITVTVSWVGPEGARSYATTAIYTDVTL